MSHGDRGFTLIELLIVVAIIAILAAIAVPNFLEAQVRAKVSRAKTDERSLAIALQAYRADNEQYPPDVGAGGPAGAAIYNRSEIYSWKQLTTPVSYITSIPLDPFFLGEGRMSPSQGVSSYRESPYFQYSEENVFSGGYGGGNDAARTIAAKASGVGFLIISSGPDRYGCFSWAASNWLAVGRNDGTVTGDGGHAICYDPTNGTVSYGDIIMSAKGLYGSK